MLSLSPYALGGSDTENILKFWFEEFNDRWFNCKPEDDRRVSQLFCHYDEKIRKKSRFTLDEIVVKTLVIDGRVAAEEIAKRILASIIVYDQFYRHHVRCYQEPILSNVDMDPYNYLTCQWVEQLLRPLDSISSANSLPSVKTMSLITYLSPSEQCFAMLPYRHSRKISKIQTAFEIIYRFNKNENDSGDRDPVYRRFLRASVASWEREFRRHGEKINLAIVLDANGHNSLSPNRQILDPLYIVNTVSLDLDHYSLLMRYLIRWGLAKISFPSLRLDTLTTDRRDTSEDYVRVASPYTESNVVYMRFRENIMQLQASGKIGDSLAVSLSGGVDSLLATYFALILRQEGVIKRIVAIHINYGNREKSQEEAKFVKEWCNHFQVPVYIREITEIYRGHAETDIRTDQDINIPQLMMSRSFYENYTRHVRYDLYRQVGLPVILGHNRDDCFENIFTNVIRGQHYDNLRAMTTYSIGLYGVPIMRPFLETNKAEIVRTARVVSLVHTQNSTPPWSERYRLRNGIIDYLAEKCPRFLLGLESLSDREAGYAARDAKIVSEVISKAKSMPLSTVNRKSVEILPTIIEDIELFKKTVTEIAHTWGRPAPTHKSLQNAHKLLIDRLANKVKVEKLKPTVVLSSYLRIVPNEDGGYYLKLENDQ